jgi:hypothetical protein
MSQLLEELAEKYGVTLRYQDARHELLSKMARVS